MGKWFKIKDGQITPIKGPASIKALNMHGYTVTHDTGKKIISYSPLTRAEAFDKQRGIRQG